MATTNLAVTFLQQNLGVVCGLKFSANCPDSRKFPNISGTILSAMIEKSKITLVVAINGNADGNTRKIDVPLTEDSVVAIVNPEDSSNAGLCELKGFKIAWPQEEV